ncbi:hypothetical protein Q3G72_021049 [Acer saccharum]|nr:hypothetical protein Q3G72_021049 [Acer saccharum]
MRDAQKLFEELSVRDVVLWKAMIVHDIVVKMGYGSGVAVMNALIDMQGKFHERCGDNNGILKLFDRMLGASNQPALVTITTYNAAYLFSFGKTREINGCMVGKGCQSVMRCLLLC